MRRIVLPLALAAAALLPALASAQSDATMPPPRADAATNPIPDPLTPPAASPTGPAASAREPSSTAPNVTVTAKPLRGCKPGDQACIDQVSQLIWTRYPKQIEALCAADQWQRFRQGLDMQALGDDPNTISDQQPPATQQLCQYGAKLKKR